MTFQKFKHDIAGVLETTRRHLKKVGAPVVLGATLVFSSLSASVPSFAQGASDAGPQASAEIVPVSPPQGAESLDRAAAKCSPLVSVTSQPKPLRGQKHRSSRNIDLNGIKVGQIFKVNARSGVSFNLKRDIRLAPDPILKAGMRSGYYKRLSNYPLKPVYIADPRGAKGKAFRVTFCGI
jgi:hypothetical protein